MGELNIRKQEIIDIKEWKGYLFVILNYIKIFKNIKNIKMNKAEIKQKIEEEIKRSRFLAGNKTKIEIEHILENYDNLFEEAYNKYLDNEKNKTKKQIEESEKVNISRNESIKEKTIDLIDIKVKSRKNNELADSQIHQKVNRKRREEEHSPLKDLPQKHFSKIEKFKAMMLNWIKKATSNPNLSDIHEIKLEVEKMFLQYKENNNEFTKKEMAQIIINYGKIFKEQYEFLKEEEKERNRQIQKFPYKIERTLLVPTKKQLLERKDLEGNNDRWQR